MPAFPLQDMWGDEVYLGDTVIASRPAGAGTTALEYCRVKSVTKQSVTLIPLNRDGRDKSDEEMRWGFGPFTLQKNYGDTNACKKIIRHTA